MEMTIDQMKQTEPRYWQRLLRAAGLYRGAIDGILGKLSQAAEARWREQAEQARKDYGTFDARSEGNISTLMPEAQRAARRWLLAATKKAAALGVEVRIIDGTRTYGEQDALFKKRPRVTKAKGGSSWHNFGLAWDFGVFQGKDYIGESPHYSTLGAIARSIEGLTWGGDWTSFVDRPHIQLNKYATTAAARAAFEK